MQYKQKVIFNLFLLLIVLFVGVFLRLDDLKIWHEQYNLWFLAKNRPIFSGSDAFGFAYIAQNLINGEICSSGHNFNTRISCYLLEVPLLSFSGAKISQLFHVPLEKIAFYYPVFTSMLFAIPLFFYFYSLGYPAAGILGSLVGITSLIYVMRTSPMRFDTDCLNLFFPFIISYSYFMYFKRKKSLFWFLLGICFSFLYFWWYKDHLFLVFVPLFIFVVLLVLQKNFSQKDFLVILSIVIIFVLLLLYDFSLIKDTWFYFKWKFDYYILKSLSSDNKSFPLISISIDELQKGNFAQVVKMTLENEFLFVLGLLGFLVLLWIEIRSLIYVLPFFILGLLSFTSGLRFGMYLAPFLGIGLGLILHISIFSLSKLKGWGSRKTNLFYFLGILILSCFIVVIQKSSRHYHSAPLFNSFLARDMQQLAKILPQKALIFSWWDLGHAFKYLSQRETILDSWNYEGPKTYYVALSWVSSSPLEARNISLLISRNDFSPAFKINSFQKIEFSRPVFWVFTNDLIFKYQWISYFGNWNFQKRKGQKNLLILISPCQFKSGKELICRQNIKIDFSARKVYLSDKVYPLAKICEYQNKKYREANFDSQGLVLERVVSSYGPLYFLMDTLAFKSNFNQMFLLRRYDSRFFSLFLDDFPFMVVYQVKNK